MRELSFRLHEIAVDGLPDMHTLRRPGDPCLTGRVAFLFDGCVVSGWPLPREDHPHLYTEAAIEKRTDLANSIGIKPAEADKIRDQCGRTMTLWEANSDVGRHGVFMGVTHWIEFPVPLWDMERTNTPPAIAPETSAMLATLAARPASDLLPVSTRSLELAPA